MLNLGSNIIKEYYLHKIEVVFCLFVFKLVGNLFLNECIPSWKINTVVYGFP